MDEEQIVGDALDVLRAIMREYPGEPVSLIAGSMQLQVRPDADGRRTKGFPYETKGRPGPVVNAMDERSFVNAAATAVEKRRGSAYKTPVFKCLEDYERCRQGTSSPHLCKALLAVCVGKHLIPFTK